MASWVKIKTVVEKLKGSIEVSSLPGRGTGFVIRLPLAMSITEGIIVGTDSHQYIIPIIHIRESLRPKKEACFTVEGKGEMIRLRESLLPLIRLDRLFGAESMEKNPWDAMGVVVENGEDIGCILVDEVFGKQEIAIQNLGGGGWLDSAKCVAGGSIMASGRVSLILDIPGIFKCYRTSPSV